MSHSEGKGSLKVPAALQMHTQFLLYKSIPGYEPVFLQT
jgi:hypothetical protein